MNVNVRGVMLGCKYAIPHMIRNGGGSIINTASDSGLAGDNVRIAYGTSKAAVIGLTKYVAAQHGRQSRSEEHTSELQSLMRISYAVFCLKKKKQQNQTTSQTVK